MLYCSGPTPTGPTAVFNDAQADLERCTQRRTNGVGAHLLLATVLTKKKNDIVGATKRLRMAAEKLEPHSSELLVYQGELLLAQQEFYQAKEQFIKAIKLEPRNPIPYLSATIASLNNPPEPGHEVEINKEAAQFQRCLHGACVKMGMVEKLELAREVVQLYEQGL
jgi:tetratricopeptide (TPR) repeat protein